jgi:CreA protein
MAIDFTSELTISVAVSDWNAARAWYREKLGFEEGFVVEEGGWAEFAVPGGAILGLNALNGEPHPGAGGTTLTLGVKNLDEARTALEGAGVQFLGPTDEMPGMVRLATFQDPDGNVMMLAQNLMQP